MKQQWYIVLGISQSSTEADIKNAHKKLAKKYHPDLMINATEEEKNKAQEKMKEINAAYEEALKFVSTHINTTNFYSSNSYENNSAQTSYYRNTSNRNFINDETWRIIFDEILKDYRNFSYYDMFSREREQIKREETFFGKIKQEPENKRQQSYNQKVNNTFDEEKRKKLELEKFKIRAKIKQFYPFIPESEIDEYVDEILKLNRGNDDNFDDILIAKVKSRKLKK